MFMDANDKGLKKTERLGIAYLNFTDYDPNELLSLHISELDPSENIAESARHFNKIVPPDSDLMAGGYQHKYPSIWSAKVSTSGNSLNKGWHFTFIRDTSEHKNRELEKFFYSICHDLKSPLLTVRTYTGMLRRDLLNADQSQINEDLHYIAKAADKMQQLLDALQHYWCIGRKDAPPQTLSAGQLVDNCLTALAGIIQQQQVEITTNPCPWQLHGNPLHFEHIWQNLIENAIKYRDNQTQPSIKIGATPQGHEVIFYVRDNGIGIAPEHSERIFNLFSQINAGNEGNGLGLALVKHIVSIYQGRIWVESAGDGRGSCFMFTLPAALVKQGKAR